MIKRNNPNDPNSGFMITKSSIPMYRLILLKSQLESEIKGLRWRQSAYAMIKKEFGLKGSRQKVLDQFLPIFEKAQQDHQVIQALEVE